MDIIHAAIGTPYINVKGDCFFGICAMISHGQYSFIDIRIIRYKPPCISKCPEGF